MQISPISTSIAENGAKRVPLRMMFFVKERSFATVLNSGSLDHYHFLPFFGDSPFMHTKNFLVLSLPR